MKKKYIGIVVPETHWDRTWYYPFQGFRLKLVKMFKDLLNILKNDKNFRNFSFDGQTVVLEDFLEVHPEKKDEIKKHIKSGRLSVGPWYILPDEFLVSGEALIRNLETGHEIAKSYGRVMKAGYIPDPFGHISQLPAIMSGFGINSVIFSRGADKWIYKTGPIFKWLGSDGKTWVYGINQFNFYGNIANWGGGIFNSLNVDLKLALEQIENNIVKWKKVKGRHKTILFNNGMDHLPAQAAVPLMIKHVNKNSKNINLINADFEEYVKRVVKENLKLSSYKGEMHSGCGSYILSGTFSARMWIHQKNWEVQKFLEETVEPFLARQTVLGYKHDRALLKTAWKHLLKCHPHDDICGCSVDGTHEDNKFNFKAAYEIGQHLILNGLEAEAESMLRASNAVRTMAVYNGSFYNQKAEVNGILEIAKDMDPAALHVEALDGTKIPCVIKPVKEQNFYLYQQVKLAKQYDVSFFDSRLPANGIKMYAIKEGENKINAFDIKAGAGSIENRYYEIKINKNGTVDILNKETGIVYKNQNYFEDMEDAGDEYDHSPLPKSGSKTFVSHGLKAKIKKPEMTPWSASLTAEVIFMLPEAITKDGKARSKKLVPVKIRTTVKLITGEKRIDFKTEIINTAKDHRLRAVFKTPVKTKTVNASQHFDVIKRNVEMVKGTEKYIQPEVPTQHMDDFVSVSDKKSGFTIMSKGLHEYEARKTGGKTEFCLTLLRSCGMLSKETMLTRNTSGAAGPRYYTPGAQCIGEWSFEYAVIPHKDNWLVSKAYIEAKRMYAGAILYDLKNPDKKVSTKKNDKPLFEIENPEVVITSMRDNTKENGIELRFFNISDKAISARVKPQFNFKEAFITGLDGIVLKKANVSCSAAEIPAMPKEIITVLFILEERNK